MELLRGLAVNILVFAALGAIIGLICGDRPGWLLVTAPLASLMLFIISQFYFGLLSAHWSMLQNLSDSIYQIAPYLFLNLLPCVLTTIFVGRWRSRVFQRERRNRLTNRCS